MSNDATAREAVPEPMKWLERVSAQLLSTFSNLRREVQRPVRLSKREKRLALTAAYASVGCSECLAGCIKEGLKEGLTLEELLEAASISVLVRGADALMTVHKALKSITEGE